MTSRALFVFPHQDDEYAAAPWIVEERAAGAELACVYLTDGGKRVPPAVRDEESRRALHSLGVPSQTIAIIALPSGRVPDGGLCDRAGDVLEALETWLQSSRFIPDRIYAPSYEGGHPDHDAAHVIAGVLATRRGISGSSWHYSVYNAYGCPRPFFSSLHQLPSAMPVRRASLSLAKRLELSALCGFYRSQRRTWIGLFPQAFLERVVLGRESVVRFDARRLRSRPHAGELLYERMFGARYEKVTSALAPLVEEILERTPSSNDKNLSSNAAGA